MKFGKKIRRLSAAASMAVLMALGSTQAASAAVTGKIGWKCVDDAERLASAAKYTQNTSFTVEAGQKFYLSDMFGIEGMDGSKFVMKDGKDASVSYTSSDAKLAIVGNSCKSRGYVITKKAGTVKLTATFQRKKYVCTLKIVGKGKLGAQKSAIKKLNTAAAALVKYDQVKVSDKNVADLTRKVTTYQKSSENAQRSAGFYSWFGFSDKGRKLIVPLFTRAESVSTEFEMYCNEHRPEDSFRVKKVSAAGGKTTLTAVLAKPVTLKDLYVIQYNNRYDSKLARSTYSRATARTRLSVNGPDGGYEGVALLTKGKRTVTVTLYQDYSLSRKAKLKKGSRYTLCGYSFTAK